MVADEIAGRLWPGRRVELEPLGRGITNHNFKVTVDGEALVPRIGVKDTGLLRIDLDFDFVGYAAEHFDRVERTASDPSLSAALPVFA